MLQTSSPATPACPAWPAVPSAAPAADWLDPAVHAALARASASLSGASALLGGADWALHLAASPGKQLDLWRLAWTQAAELAAYAAATLQQRAGLAPACVEPPAQDRRFADPAWQQWPYSVMHQSFLLAERWWSAATQGVWGVEPHHERQVAFAARQWLDMASPGNALATNPVALARTAEEGGLNLLRGWANLQDDWRRTLRGEPPAGSEEYAVGRRVAVTPGEVVLRNRLIELIQYRPTTARVHPEPILIVPAWIMKYYILDLMPQDSLVRYLVDHGHTVFCLSWKNVGADDRDLGMDDYLDLGFRAALAAVRSIVPQQPVHAAGYCLGGTLLAIGAAALARDGDERLASMTLFAAQTDFTEPGELGLFIDEAQVSLLEAQMAETGVLASNQMAGAFQMLRSYDLLWSRLVGEALLGERPRMNDLMAWNADATRLPARMHSEYLRRLFLHNDLAEGRYPVDGRALTLQDLRLPVFVVGTEADHVAPWRSVHKLHHLCAAELTFALGSGGHNVGIVNPPGAVAGSAHIHYRIATRAADGVSLAPDDWLAQATDRPGSWWPAWQAWLAARSGAPVAPPAPGSAAYPVLAPAPGSYVLER
ncbi:MAG: alpha/beta fold hydrolase [Burkholderiales bacterium]|nr:alpha/beta fold hydrolase [Burkholderiales bacterium]